VTGQLSSTFQDWQKTRQPCHRRQLNYTTGTLCLSTVPLDIRTCEKKSLSITQKSISKIKDNKMLVFAWPSGQSHHDITVHIHLSGLRPSGQLHCDLIALYHPSGLAKTKPVVRNREKLILIS
jgi:hypothetical protein